MPGPSVTFGFVIATLFGAGFHLALGGGARRLALFLTGGWIGFTLGHIFGVVFEVTTLSIGMIHMLPASTGAALLLLFAHLITKPSSSR